MLALLAFACVPALAQAEACDAGGVQYGECGLIPKSGAKGKHPKSGGGGEPDVTPGKPRSEGGGAETPPAETESEPEGKHAGGAGGGKGDDGQGGADRGGSPAAGGPDGGHPGHSGGGGADSTKAPITHAGGGSSPLIPILIAVAVLAALSIGTVIYRQRRQIPIG